MITLTFTENQPLNDRLAALRPYVGERVTVRIGKVTSSGKLEAVGKRSITVSSVYQPIHANDLVEVTVHTGGDWVTSTGHGSGAMTNRIAVRCTPAEKAALKAYVATHGDEFASVSDLLRRVGLKKIGGQP